MPRHSGRVTGQKNYTGTKVLFGPLDSKSVSDKELRHVPGGFSSGPLPKLLPSKQSQDLPSQPAAALAEDLAELLRRKDENGVTWGRQAPDRSVPREPDGPWPSKNVQNESSLATMLVLGFFSHSDQFECSAGAGLGVYSSLV
jgi:hypothetical protein